MIEFKSNCRIKVYSPPLHAILGALHSFHMQNSALCPLDIMVTSINDSNHMAGSRHYTDEAIDIRSNNFKPENKTKFVTEFEQYLNSLGTRKFTVLLEDLGIPNEHIHVQVRKGTK
jgi:hypothetical protein